MTADRQQALDLLERTAPICARLARRKAEPSERRIDARGKPVLRVPRAIIRSSSAATQIRHRDRAVISASGGERDRAAHGDLRRSAAAPRPAASRAGRGDEFHRRAAAAGSSDMIGVFTKLAADVFQKSFKLAKRPGADRRRQDIDQHGLAHSRRPGQEARLAAAADQGGLSRASDPGARLATPPVQAVA